MTVSGNGGSVTFRAGQLYDPSYLDFLVKGLFDDMCCCEWDDFESSGGVAFVLEALFSAGAVHDIIGSTQAQRQEFAQGFARGVAAGMMGLNSASSNSPQVPTPPPHPFGNSVFGFGGLGFGMGVGLAGGGLMLWDGEGRAHLPVAPQPRREIHILSTNLDSNMQTYSRSEHYDMRFFIDGIATPFTVEQFRSFCGADNILIDDLLVYYLNRFYIQFGAVPRINSGFRTPGPSGHDVAVGGTGSGQHTFGRAADFQIPNVTQWELYNFATELGFRSDSNWNRPFGFTYRLGSNSIHIDTRLR